jgi:hypothetical protein
MRHGLNPPSSSEGARQTICAIVRTSPSGYLRSIDDIEPVLDLFTPHGRTTTSIVNSAPVPPRPLPVPAG